MRTSLAAAGFVIAVVGAFVTLAGVPDAVNQVCGFFLTSAQCADDFWIRAIFALIFIAVASACAFGLGVDWQKKRFVRISIDGDQPQPRTQNIILMGSNFRGTIGGLDIRIDSSEDGDSNEGENQENEDEKRD